MKLGLQRLQAHHEAERKELESSLKDCISEAQGLHALIDGRIAERDAAVREALERAVDEVRTAFAENEGSDNPLSYLESAITRIRSLAPRTDLVCVSVEQLVKIRALISSPNGSRYATATDMLNAMLSAADDQKG